MEKTKAIKLLFEGVEKMKWKLFCTVTMEIYYEEADNEYQARKQLAKKLKVPLSCIDVFRV